MPIREDNNRIPTLSSPEETTENDNARRADLLKELNQRYTSGRLSPSLRGQFQFVGKWLVWVLVIGGAKALKRGLDIVVSLLALALLFPLFVIVALTIHLTDRGPVLFWQQRVGKYGKVFAFPKFRSMVLNAEKLKDTLLNRNSHQGVSGVTFKMKNDPRITPIGRIIRKLSIDELPQLWCVLKGEMSLVGPRPPLPREVALYTLHDRRRLDVTPGLTCFWQVEGRGDIPFPQQVEMDIRYIESQSFWLDIRILFQTVPAVLLGKGAY